MAKKSDALSGIEPEQLLAELPEMKLGEEELNKTVKDSPLEEHLLSLADVSIERETDLLRRVLVFLGKLTG
jgi:hypothetical protein